MVIRAASASVDGRRPSRWRDTREWLERVDGIGQLRTVRGVDWERGIGEVAELLDHAEGSPAVLFDEVPGYPAGHRVLVNASGTPQRQAVTLGASPRRWPPTRAWSPSGAASSTNFARSRRSRPPTAPCWRTCWKATRST
jgi:3-polyprenyl-4-hydroxybenzoate decarboxylase